MLKRHWPLLAFAAALLALLLAYVAGSSAIREMAAPLLVIVPIAWSLSQYAYREADRYRLFVDRLRARLRNPNVVWGLAGEIQLRDGEAAAAWSAAEKALPEPIEVISSTWGDYSAVLEGGVALRVRLQTWTDPVDGELAQVTAKLHPTTGTLRFWRDRVDNTFIPIMRKIEAALAPHANHPYKYSVDIIFEPSNPYFGYFVARVERDALQHFDVAFYEDAAQEKSLVQVREDRLSFVTRTLDAARGLSLKHLALQEVRK